MFENEVGMERRDLQWKESYIQIWKLKIRSKNYFPNHLGNLKGSDKDTGYFQNKLLNLPCVSKRGTLEHLQISGFNKATPQLLSHTSSSVEQTKSSSSTTLIVVFRHIFRQIKLTFLKSTYSVNEIHFSQIQIVNAIDISCFSLNISDLMLLFAWDSSN
jgi:hypothetical protein